MVQITESGMTFERDEAKIYHIDQSPTVKKWQGVKTVEFVCLQPNHIEVIECKTSIPKDKDSEFYQEIRQKFEDTLTILFSAKLGRYPVLQNEIPVPLLYAINFKTAFQIYLIVYGMPDEYACGYTEILREKLRHFLQLWNIPTMNVFVMGDAAARKKKLIL